MQSIKLLRLGAAVALATSFMIPASQLPVLPLCPFKILTGLPCPGCGLTHAFCEISHGHLKAAWQANPFGFLFYILALACLTWPWLRARFPGIEISMRRTRALLWAPAVLGVGMWVYDVVRIARP
jgi:type IV secretory pathway TrbD component